MFKASGSTQFDKLLEKATSQLLLEPEWSSILQICDLIRQKDCPTKYAIAAIKKKLHHQNPHVAMFGLQVLESTVKNCGSPVHDEIATKQFMEELKEVAKITHHENVRDKILELIQTWAHAFRKIPSYRAVQDVLNIMKAEGAAFKPLIESDAMFVADSAPEWADGECCHRCRSEFGLVVRKHHCRACGQIFCGKCSSKMCTLPKFGIEKEVRVCDSCFDKYGKDGSSSSDPEELLMRATTQPQTRQPPAQAPGAAKSKTEEELAEEEQLQLALAISQSEAEAKEMEAKKRSGGSLGNSQAYSFPVDSSGTERERTTEKSSPQKSTETEDPELARYLNRTYWENRPKDENSKEETGTSTKGLSVSDKSATKSVAWNSINYSFLPSAPIKENREKGEQVEEIDTFVMNLRGQIEMFVNRMKSNSSRGRPISYDTSVQGLFMNITALHSQLLNFIQAQDNARTYYEGLQDKLGQIRDARAALDDLRLEHNERLRREAEEQERIKQFKMAEKLQTMRLKKQEYLQYQRQLAMQRMQEQEREMQMRIEQQKQQMGNVPPGPYGNYGQIPPGMPGYMPQGPPPGGEINYMQQHGPPGQFISPPNVTIGQQPPGQPMGQYMPPHNQPQYMPQGQMQHNQQPTSNQGPPQQQNPMPHQQMYQQPQVNTMPQQQQQPHPIPQAPQNYQQPPNVPQGGDPNSGGPIHLQSEPSTAELISFD